MSKTTEKCGAPKIKELQAEFNQQVSKIGRAHV